MEKKKWRTGKSRRPVSYTHLGDITRHVLFPSYHLSKNNLARSNSGPVYGRGIGRQAIGVPFLRVPVSYTHLDEYKRQEYCVPKYAIQTLVENAVLHGIDPMGGEGRISVKGEKEGKDLCIRVTDNGVGIPEGKLKKIRDRLASARETSDEEGIGIQNVNDRLTMHFGEAYAVQLNSMEEQGTEVVFRVPCHCLLYTYIYHLRQADMSRNLQYGGGLRQLFLPNGVAIFIELSKLPGSPVHDPVFGRPAQQQLPAVIPLVSRDGLHIVCLLYTSSPGPSRD